MSSRAAPQRLHECLRAPRVLLRIRPLEADRADGVLAALRYPLDVVRLLLVVVDLLLRRELFFVVLQDDIPETLGSSLIILGNIDIVGEELHDAVRAGTWERVAGGLRGVVRFLAVEGCDRLKDARPGGQRLRRCGGCFLGRGRGCVPDPIRRVASDQEGALRAAIVLVQRVVRVEDRRVAQNVEVDRRTGDRPRLLAKLLSSRHQLFRQVVGDVEREVAAHDGHARRGRERAGVLNDVVVDFELVPLWCVGLFPSSNNGKN